MTIEGSSTKSNTRTKTNTKTYKDKDLNKEHKDKRILDGKVAEGDVDDGGSQARHGGGGGGSKLKMLLKQKDEEDNTPLLLAVQVWALFRFQVLSKQKKLFRLQFLCYHQAGNSDAVGLFIDQTDSVRYINELNKEHEGPLHFASRSHKVVALWV